MTRRTLTTILALAFLSAPLLAQKPSAAETAFKEAWWAETGSGDLSKALAAYLRAATAEGPVEIRAQALLHVGAIQQRMGNTESALNTFRKLIESWPEQADLVEKARVHLRELTAVDLRENYDEWYERRLFSEEVQERILTMIERLGGVLSQRPRKSAERNKQRDAIYAIEGELITFGAGAVPALKKTVLSPNTKLASSARKLLFRLGELPPIESLVQDKSWMWSDRAWRVLLALPRETAAALSQEVKGEWPAAQFLRAAFRGPENLLALLITEQGSMLMENEDSDVIHGIVRTLVFRCGHQVRQQLFAASRDRNTPFRVREGIEQAILWEDSPMPVSVTDWLALGADPIMADLRTKALRGAAIGLRAHDGDALDEILSRAENAPEVARLRLVQSTIEGLAANPTPLQLPWTLSRLRRLLILKAGVPHDESMGVLFQRLRYQEDTRKLIVEAVLGDAVAMHRAYPPGDRDGYLSEQLRSDPDDEWGGSLFETRWNETVRAYLDGAWEEWTADVKLAAVVLLNEVIHSTAGDRKTLGTFLTGKTANGEPPEVETAINELMSGWGG